MVNLHFIRLNQIRLIHFGYLPENELTRSFIRITICSTVNKGVLCPTN